MPRRFCNWLILSAVLLSGSYVTADDQDGFKSIFDGETLEGWDGDPKFWTVKDGAITGQTTAENPTKGNTFIIWEGGDIGDFELKLEYKIVGGNSGIQYRSFVREGGPDKWRIGGYQGDLEAGDRYSGICYGEAFRGILADRGEKTELVRVDDKFQKKVVGSVGDRDEIGKQIKKEDWNTYHIIARGFQFVQKINGVTTCEFTDNDEKMRRAKGLLALQLHAGPPMTVQFRNIQLKKLGDAQARNGDANKTYFVANRRADEQESQQSSGKKKVVFVAGRRSHGYGSHEHFAGCMLLAKHLQQATQFDVEVVKNGWPEDESIFDGVDCVVMYADGGGRHPVIPHLDAMDKLADKGVGVACVHYGVEVPAGEPGDHLLKWIGGYFETNWSVNPHWTAKFDKFPEHPITRGVKPFAINDEWYYHMRFRKGMDGVTPILTDLPGADTLSRPDGAHSGNPHVRAAVLEREEPQHVAWASERDGQRGFGFTGGHVHWNWSEPNFRKLVLNAITWCAKAEVPAGGIREGAVTLEALEENQDYDPPRNFDRESIRERFQLPAEKTSALRTPAAKPLFSSKVVTSRIEGHSVDIDVDISNAKQLHLVVTDGRNGYSCDWADWAEPRLVGPNGERKLTELKWQRATTSWGEVHVNKNAGGGPLRVAGKPVEYGIGTHANSVISFDLPAGYTRFKARGALDNGGTEQGNGGATSVQFHVFTAKPGRRFLTKFTASGDAGSIAASHESTDAVDQLDVHPKLAASLFASEPMMANPTNIDIDHLGRVWVFEVINYRRFRNGDQPERKEGDRILILEDTDGDGKADKSSTFYQGRDMDGGHGICVLATPSGKGTRALVSSRDSVFFLIDEDGDLKCDRKELLFTGISGAEHDHGIHAFVFGPDGKLYFNFGNSGKQIKDRDGKSIVDLAGNEVNDSRQPYQQGMVFRCNLDGSEFETLGWNFRNNWEVAVDSYGTLWQSDNDDDGNRGVRINFVMEFGNYGYVDEFTGAGWKAERTGMHDEIPKRHWHLNDPGVVPNLLQTGAGSPTGICIYEGDLLPEVFRGQMIHSDAGPNIVRAYPVTNNGAGYNARIVDILDGAVNKWFRPTDPCVAPDGSVLASDWYDPGVGGHRMQDTDHGRIFRIVPKGHDGKYRVPKQDFSTVEGAIQALLSPNLATRYVGWTALHEMGEEAEPALMKVYSESDNPRHRARALWVMGKLDGRGPRAIELAIDHADPNIRALGIRLARQLKHDVIGVAAKLAQDSSPLVRREVAIAIRHAKSPKAAGIWAQLAMQYDGKDRWYLEALGIAADKQWDAFLGAWLKEVGDDWNTPAGRDILWRSRAKQTPGYLARVIKDAPAEQHPRYLRAFDFLSGPEKDKALESILLDL